MAAPGERVVRHGGPIRVVDHGGTGTAIVCIHGLGGSRLDWQVLAPSLTRHGRVLALDLPGFGDSPSGPRAVTLARLQEAVDGVLKAEADGPATLVGNSLGGMLAVLQAAARPASVERLVLLSPVLPAALRRLPHPVTTAQFAVYALPSAGEWFVRYRRRRLGPQRLVDLSLRFIAARPDAIPVEIYAQRAALVARQAARPGSERALLTATRSMLAFLARPSAYERMIRRVTAPTLVLHGTHDRLVSVRAAVALRTVRPDWTVEVLDDVGHVPQLEAAPVVADQISRWFAGSGSAAADRAGPD